MALLDLDFDILLPVQAVAGSMGAVTAEQRRMLDKSNNPDQLFGVSSRKLHPDGTLTKNLFTGVQLQRVYPHQSAEAVGLYVPEKIVTIFDGLVNACSSYVWLPLSVTPSGFAFEAAEDLTPLYQVFSPPVLQNGFVRIEMDVGAEFLGSNPVALGGMRFDPTGLGNYGNRDFSSPGSPFERWGIELSGYPISFNSGVWAETSAWYVNGENLVVRELNYAGGFQVILGFYLPSGSKSLFMRMGLIDLNASANAEALAGVNVYMNRFIDPDQGRTYSTPSYDDGGTYHTYNTLTDRNSAMAYEPGSGWTLEVRGCATYPAGAFKPSVRMDWNESPLTVFEQPSHDAYYTDSTINAVCKIPFDNGVAVYDLLYSFYAMPPDLALQV